MPSAQVIEDFLAQPRIAVVGVSRNPKAFANACARQLRTGGRTVYGVNPHADAVDGERCYHSVGELPDVDGVVVMVNASDAPAVVAACVARGVPRVWLHRGAGPGAVSPEAVAACRDAGVAVVDGACPMMFAEPVGWFHRSHRFFVRRRLER